MSRSSRSSLPAPKSWRSETNSTGCDYSILAIQPVAMPMLFVSDLHLSAARPEKIRLLQELLHAANARGMALYILGDLFEVWAGDDDMTPPHTDVVTAFSDFSRNGGELAIMHGNRDFLIGKAFCTATGARLVDDPGFITLASGRALISHGDQFCTRDWSYQLYRRLVRAPSFRRNFLRLPAGLRTGLAHGFHRISRMLSRGKPPAMTDVEQSTVEQAMREHHVDTVIHGHTHRPGLHHFSLDGRPARRIVLGDWYEQDSVLISDSDGERLLRVREWLNER